MNPNTVLEQIDADGAIREAAHDATESLEGGDTRMDFLKKAGLADGAVIGGGALLGALSPAAALAKGGKGRPPAKFGKGDVGILNYALTLEYLEAAFYNETTANANKHHFMKNKQSQLFLKETTKDENAHVTFLKKALGKKAVAAPKLDFGRATHSESRFLKLAFTFENTGVHAYSGQVLNIQSQAYVAAAASILTVEARHASVVGLILDRTPDGISPEGTFDTPLTANQVLKAVKSLHVIR